MNITPTSIKGLYEIHPGTFPDERGWFMELYKNNAFSELHSPIEFVQDNLSFSKKDVLRGLHLQFDQGKQAKLVTVLQGKVLDVVVDLREGSNDFSKVYTCVLDAQQHNMLLIPEGFAHGFLALKDSLFFYKCSKKYNPEYETGIHWDDSHLKIKWGIKNPILSRKDKKLPTFEELLTKGIILAD